MVVKFEFQLFNKESLINRPLIYAWNELMMIPKSKLKQLQNTVLNGKILDKLIENDLTKSQIECKSTQGIGNNDVIIRTKLRKLRNFRLTNRPSSPHIDPCTGFVCGKMDFNSEKLRFNP